MNKQWLDGMWDHMRQKYGVYLRVLDTIPADEYDARPIPDMRTPKELVVHTSSLVRDVAEGIASGAIAPGEQGEDVVIEGLGSKQDVLDFARDCWRRADAAIQKVGDAQLQAPVENAWGIDLNGTFAAIIINDEFLHHRGQLYAYSRATGGEPPFMWGFDENPEGFRPGG